MKKLMLFAVSLLLLSVQILSAQKTITGKLISDENPGGEPFANVKVTGTSIGTTTDENGNYNLTVPNDAVSLEFSTTGKETKTIPIKGTKINAKLLTSATEIVGVTITGYGVQRKAGNTGASNQVDGHVVKQTTQSNVINGMEGSTPGLQISSSTGQPGAPTTARIRGVSSVNSGNTPLYVIDGVPVSSESGGLYNPSDPMAGINPDDIENISVLKDASATSIYGSRASNGVIVITTKRGKAGTSKLTFNGKVGVGVSPFIKKSFQKLSISDYKEYLLELKLNGLVKGTVNYDQSVANDNANIWKAYQAQGVDFTNGNMPAGTDWWKAVTQLATIQDYSLTASGGDSATTYFASLGYFKNKGLVVGSDMTRYNARLNLDHKAKSWLTMGLNISGSYSQINTVPTSLGYASPIWGAENMRPTDPIMSSAHPGEWFNQGEELYSYFNGYNPVALRAKTYPDGTINYHDIAYQQQFRALVSPYLRFQLAKNVFAQTKLGVDYTTTSEHNVWSQTVNPQGQGLNGLTQNINQGTSNLTFTNTVNWLPSIGKNNFNVLIGQEAQYFNDNYVFATGQNFINPSLNLIGNASITTSAANVEISTLSSYFTNVEYDYNNLYYLSASVREDGSSRFGSSAQPGNKWGTFYSVGGKYRISNEAFMANTQSWLDNLSLRASYGTSGNQNVGSYQSQGIYASTSYANENALIASSTDLPDLKWESRNKFDIGIDFSVFHLLTVGLDYYNDVTHNMIFEVPQSFATGFPSNPQNVGKMGNQGIEAQINALIMNKPNFKWTIGANYTMNKNKILKLATSDPIIGGIRITEVGLPVGSFYTQEYAGVDPATGRPRWWGTDKNGNREYVYSFNQADKVHMGSSNPLCYGGFNTKFEFFHFDLNFQFNYSIGGKVFVNDIKYLETIGEGETRPTTYYVWDHRWQNPGDQTNVPQIIYGGNNGADNFCSRQLCNASYLSLKSIMLGYTLAPKYVKKMKLSNFRAYFAIDNLYTLSSKDFRGFTPESGLGGSIAANYPSPTNYTLGVTIGF